MAGTGSCSPSVSLFLSGVLVNILLCNGGQKLCRPSEMANDDSFRVHKTGLALNGPTPGHGPNSEQLDLEYRAAIESGQQPRHSVCGYEEKTSNGAAAAPSQGSGFHEMGGHKCDPARTQHCDCFGIQHPTVALAPSA
jgi:hypothetical protein